MGCIDGRACSMFREKRQLSTSWRMGYIDESVYSMFKGKKAIESTFLLHGLCRWKGLVWLCITPPFSEWVETINEFVNYSSNRIKTQLRTTIFMRTSPTLDSFITTSCVGRWISILPSQSSVSKKD